MVDANSQSSQGSQNQASSGSAQNAQINIDPKLMYIVSYLILIIGGLVVFLVYGDKDKRLKFHALQSIAYGIIIYIFYFVIAALLFFNYFMLALLNLIILVLWLYGLYIGYMAYSGKETPIPFLTDFLQKNIKL